MERVISALGLVYGKKEALGKRLRVFMVENQTSFRAFMVEIQTTFLNNMVENQKFPIRVPVTIQMSIARVCLALNIA